MNWITNYVRPRINSIFSRREMPDNLWTKCDECGTMLFHRELSEALNVCTKLRPSHADLAAPAVRGAVRRRRLRRGRRPRPARRPAEVPRPETLSRPAARRPEGTGEAEAMLVAEGEMGRTPIVAVAQDFSSWAGRWACMWATPSSPPPNAP
jgi:acetyl-CoA carboxylase carboxyl transferase subunit beta